VRFPQPREFSKHLLVSAIVTMDLGTSLVNSSSDLPDYERSLASVVVIRKLVPIAGADQIRLAHVNGWQCVVKNSEFDREGELAIYFSIDSIPDLSDPNMETVKKRGGRIKTIKLRGVVSQGLLAPLSWMECRGFDISNLVEGQDVTQQMGVTKYIHEDEQYQYDIPDGLAKTSTHRAFPHGIPRTEERRLQDHPNFLEYISNRNVIITRKEDGCSATFVYCNQDYLVAGRNIVWSSDSSVSHHYFRISEAFGLEDKMRSLDRQLAIQGEIVGPKINGNKLRLKELDFRVFNIWSIDEKRYLPWSEVVSICANLGLHTVPLVYSGPSGDLCLTVDGFLSMADTLRYECGSPAEGIVIRAEPDEIDHRGLSFKVISNRYLLKHDL
jgi:RNA ligase (TIGR02306 family)